MEQEQASKVEDKKIFSEAEIKKRLKNKKTKKKITNEKNHSSSKCFMFCCSDNRS